MLWSGLLHDRDRLAVELSKVGITEQTLVNDVRDVDELRERCKLLHGKPDALLRLALEHFGDQARPQPAERTVWRVSGRTADWGRLPRLDERDASTGKRKRGTDPYPRKAFWDAYRALGENKLSTRAIERATGISRKRLEPIERFRARGADYELESGPIPDTVILRRR